MNLLRRPLAWLGERLINLAHWEAAELSSRDRGYLPGEVTHAHVDLSQCSRSEIVRKSRYWEKNSGLCNRIADIWEQYLVGPNGFAFSPSTSSPGFNELASETWARWSDYADLSSRLSVSKLASLCAYRWFWDGEISILKTRGESGRPRVQLIECERIGNPWHTSGAIDGVHDGVRVDPNGRPVSYFIQNTFDGGEFVERPAESLIRVFEPSRAGQLRGFPVLASVLNTVQDLSDLQTLEMRAAKSAAKRVWHVKRKPGGETDVERLRRQRLTTAGTTGSGSATTENRDVYFSRALGGETTITETDEDISLLESQRPSVAVQNYWDFLIDNICAGSGVSRLLVLSRSTQGTVTRSDLDIAATFFRSRSSVLIEAFRQVYVYVIGGEMRFNPALAKAAPKDWQRVSIRPPRAVNVDVGRNSNAMVSEMKAGTLTFEGVIGDNGQDWREHLRQRARERKFIRELATEYGVDPVEIAELPAPQPEPIATPEIAQPA